MYLSRRRFLNMGSLSVAGWLLLPKLTKAYGVPYAQIYPVHNIPASKNIDPQWLKSLYERGGPTTYLKSKNELKYIGMPAGGLHCGTLYFGGDGRLWLWGIYNDDRKGIDPKIINWNDGNKDRQIGSGAGACYVEPTIADNKRVLAQGFAVKINYKGHTIIKELRSEDWDEISFEATYPLATVIYTAKDLPVKIVLTGGAFFIPLLAKDSGLPATSFNIQIQNISAQEIEIAIAGWLENGANKISAKKGDGRRQNSFASGESYHAIDYTFQGADERSSEQRDAGTMCFALIGQDGMVNTDADPFPVREDLFSLTNNDLTQKEADEKLIGSLSSLNIKLQPNQAHSTDFVIAWHFNHTLAILHDKIPASKKGHYYGTLYKNAAAVMSYITDNFQRLQSQTKLWQQTFYDATLPHWFLERTFLNIGTIATANTYRFADGRFWGWEGVNACLGTCTHVWSYAQAFARIFPEIERDTRHRVELGTGMLENGGINYRGEFSTMPAIDGQAGTILRTYREHQMSPDNTFLQANWMNIKRAVIFLLAQDKNGDGMEDIPMENTLDASWDGEIAWIVGLCIAATKAAEMMAVEMNDHSFAKICRDYVEKGNRNMSEKLFNGEYFIHRPDPVQGRKKVGSYNTCHIDQVYGQSWAHQAGMGRLWDKDKSLSALRSLWKYNFAPDVGPYIKTHTGGRPYALEGEAGLLMNTNPYNEPKPYGEEGGEEFTRRLGYFNECMSGFEHQVASHMMAEGMTDEALVITRAIHERYHGSKRNPYNEIEFSDHYARAMASYGTFISACGFEYHGPKGYIRFAPKLSRNNFKTPFTAAEGWGTYKQWDEEKLFTASYEVHFGRLRLKTIGIDIHASRDFNKLTITLNGRKLAGKIDKSNDTIFLLLKNELILETKQTLNITLNS